MTLKLIDTEITGQSTAQLITQQLGALLKAEFDNQYNLYGNKDKFNVDIHTNDHGIYQKYLEDKTNQKALINILFTNATLDDPLSDGTQEATYTYTLQLVTKAATNVTTGDKATKLGADKMQELIFIISQIMTYYVNRGLQLNLVHKVKIANYQVGQVQEQKSVDKNIGCSLDLEIKAREKPLLSTANDLQGIDMELDYNNKMINLTIDT
jgi:hypothetical protein